MTHRPEGREWKPGSMVLAIVVGTAAIAMSEMRLHAESVNMTTFFSAPRGLFEELRVMGETRLANAVAAQVLVDPAPPLGGPPDKMVVDGNVNALRFVGPRIVPVGAIAIFRGGCPAGWVRIGAFDGRAIRGAGAYGATFDSATIDHVHTLNHVHSTNDPVPDVSGIAGDHGHWVTGANHNHSYGAFGGTGGSGTQNPGMDDGSDWFILYNHGHPGQAGASGGASSVDYPVGNTGDHTHAYDYGPTVYGGAVPMTLSNKQPPSINVVYCGSP